MNDDPGPSSNYYRSFPSTADGPIRPPSPPTSPILTSTALPPHPLERDLYGLLNLPKSASDAEIRDRYRSLATIYHPDRQRTEQTRAAAHAQFTEIQRAYEILTDPTKRTIYDLFGEEGLKTSWEIGPRVKTAEEMRRWFTAQAYEKRSMDAEALVKPKGDIEMVLDARAVFLSKKFFRQPNQIKHDPISRVLRTRPGRVVMKHSFETPISPKTQLVWEGQALTRNGRGGANLLGTVKHQFSPRLWVEGGVTLLQPRVGRFKGTFTIDEDQYLSLNAIQQTLAAPPQLGLTYGRRLYANTTGFMSYESGTFNIGPWGKNHPAPATSSLSVGLTNSKRNGTGWTVQTTAGLAASRVAADYAIKVPGGLKLKVGGEVGLGSSIAGFINAEGKVTENVRAGLILQVEVGGGIIMKVKINRLGQRISIPILLAERLDPTVLLFSALLPAVSYAGLYRYYLLPRKKERLRERVKELREENKEFIVQKKAEALDAIGLMERSVAQKVAQEREKNGLIIISAHYGLATSFTPRGIKSSEKEEEEEVIDVTIPVQALVQDGRLYIPGGKGKFNLLGFWDPCIGENKKLRVRYLFRGKLHEVTVDDVVALRAPVKAHVLDSA
ncbi:hypothetical protein CI109_103398 [Kwoniella shandongensis]|uniref:Uncharacterized protein n=1 Tax=Kwoniella shandongensis TaxID=1734106 RepID=A0A5M6BWD5_9TREE|nr:uncharacterized protein CI109_004479 [Kwoniella shandongensis]KAA5527187.1 hypothetical protein CI109_004479 [Kwoniella shandongensis]